MKYIILFLIFTISALGQVVPSTYPYAVPLPTNGATPGGTIKLNGVLNTTAYQDPRPVVWDVMVGGVPRTVGTTNEMQQINPYHRKQGMTAYVVANDKTYRLDSTLTNWVELSSGWNSALQVGASPTTNSSFSNPIAGSIQLESDTKRIAVKQSDGTFQTYSPDPIILYELHTLNAGVGRSIVGITNGYKEMSDILPGWSDAAYQAAFNSGKKMRIEVRASISTHRTAPNDNINLEIDFLPPGASRLYVAAYVQFYPAFSGASSMHVEVTGDLTFKYNTATFIAENLGTLSAIPQAGEDYRTSAIVEQDASVYINSGLYFEPCNGKIYVNLTDNGTAFASAVYISKLKISIYP